MSFREFHRHRILDFTVCENAVQKPLSESLDRTLDARAFDQINADTNYTHIFTSVEQPAVVEEALRLPHRATATGAVALQFLPAVKALIQDNWPSRRAFP